MPEGLLTEPWSNSRLHSHLHSRYVDFALHQPIVAGGVATFYLWTPSLTGFVQYRPNGDKKAHTRDTAKYYMRGNGPFGWNTLDRPGPVYLVEGLFDACRLHSMGLAALATLSNDPGKAFAAKLPFRHYVALCDGDSAGMKLAKYGHEYRVCPEGHDVSSMEGLWTLLRNY